MDQTPYVVDVGRDGYHYVSHYCSTPDQVERTVKLYAPDCPSEDVGKLMKSKDGEGVTVNRWTFSVEREW